MGYILGRNRQQATMFPEIIDEYIAENNPICVIDAFIDNLDVEKLVLQKQSLLRKADLLTTRKTC